MTKNDCILWTGVKTKDGYGKTSTKINGLRKSIGVHRLAYIKAYGEIPKGMFVCHKCDVPLCINPDHLFLGSHFDNMRDMVLKKRSRNTNMNKTHCKNGHEFKGENLINYTLKNGKTMRQCKSCKNFRSY